MQKGFSLGEMIISFVILGIIITGIAQALSAILTVSKRNALQDQQAVWQTVLNDIQDKYYVKLINSSTGAITLSAGAAVTLAANFDTTAGTCKTTLGSTEKLLNDVGHDNTLLFDPWGGQWCLMMAAGTVTRKFENYNSKLKNLVVVSEGKKRGFQNTAITPTARECPRIERDDTRFICADGAKIVRKKINDSIEKIDKLYDKLAIYAKTRVEDHPDGSGRNYFFVPTVSTSISGGVTVTTFLPAPCNRSTLRITGTVEIKAAARGRTDIFRTNITGFTDTGCESTGAPIAGARLESIKNLIGVSAQDVMNGFGGTIYLDNGSLKVRQPFNKNPDMRLPPYNARIFTRLPSAGDSENLIERYIGSY